jgi:hypothetical protein
MGRPRWRPVLVKIVIGPDLTRRFVLESGYAE